MRFLSIDIEATGLEEDDLIIEWAAVPVDTSERKVYEEHALHFYVNCPSYKELEPRLSDWVKEHNKTLIEISHREGKKISYVKERVQDYLESPQIRSFFQSEKVTLLGKSLNAIDLPFMNRDFGYEWMKKYFNHRQLDVSSIVYYAIDKGLLPSDAENGSVLTKCLGMGNVAHTALEDAIATANVYFEILKLEQPD